MLSLIDFAIVERVWDRIRANTEDDLQDNRDNVREEFYKLKASLAELGRIEPHGDAKRREAYFLMSLSASRFVAQALQFYAAIKRRKEFSAQEKSAGSDLALIDDQANALLDLIEAEKV